MREINKDLTENSISSRIIFEALSITVSIWLSYIPTRECGSKSRSDTNSDGDYMELTTAKAELDNVFNLR